MENRRRLQCVSVHFLSVQKRRLKNRLVICLSACHVQMLRARVTALTLYVAGMSTRQIRWGSRHATLKGGVLFAEVAIKTFTIWQESQIGRPLGRPKGEEPRMAPNQTGLRHSGSTPFQPFISNASQASVGMRLPRMPWNHEKQPSNAKKGLFFIEFRHS